MSFSSPSVMFPPRSFYKFQLHGLFRVHHHLHDGEPVHLHLQADSVPAHPHLPQRLPGHPLLLRGRRPPPRPARLRVRRGAGLQRGGGGERGGVQLVQGGGQRPRGGPPALQGVPVGERGAPPPRPHRHPHHPQRAHHRPLPQDRHEEGGAQGRGGIGGGGLLRGRGAQGEQRQQPGWSNLQNPYPTISSSFYENHYKGESSSWKVGKQVSV